MRFLADAGISPRTVEHLTHLGNDVLHVRELGMHRSTDREIIARAVADARSIITFDLDFGDILALGVLDRPSAVILRVSDERPDSVNARLATVLRECYEALDSGALVLVEDARYRVRRLPIG